MATGKFIAYYRVSTAKQGASGLGLEAQRKAVADYLNGGDWTLLETFTDVESGKRSDNRPELLRAMELAKLTGATLLIAKLDRLSRNAAFLMSLKDTGVAFVAVDMPNANSFTIGIMALVAQHEREAISARTKAALAAVKARGKHVGRRKGEVAPMAADLIAKGRQVQVEKADRFAVGILPLVNEMQGRGLSLRAVAGELTAKGIMTARGGAWTATTVKNLKARAA